MNSGLKRLFLHLRLHLKFLRTVNNLGSSSSAPMAESSSDLVTQLRRHEVAVAELNTLPSSRAVYQKNGNLFFRTTVPKAVEFEQRQVDAAKSKLQKLNSR